MTKARIDSNYCALDDLKFLREAFQVAEEAAKTGNHPFGALLVAPDATILMRQPNAYHPGRDMTAHAERVLMTRACLEYDPELLSRCTMYSSAEPCAMCAGAIYWAGVGRVVYGLAEKELKRMTGDHPQNPTLDLPCRIVFAAGQRHVEVVGPLLVEEAAALHRDLWLQF